VTALDGAPAAGKVRIVLADDHPLLREGLRLVIGAEPDLEVCGEASSGQEAVRLVAATRPHVLLLDITMPGGGGIGALGPIRAAWAETRVLILTMHEDAEYLRVALASGATGFLLKSAAASVLLAAIRAVHRGRAYVDPLLAGAALRGVLGAPARSARKGAAAPLSPREIEVLGQLALGYTNKEISARLSVGIKSVETYRARLSEKLGLSGRAELVRYAMEHGIIVPQQRGERERERDVDCLV
jgi:DNA-binding NarL/FixJ family response regulator